MLAISCPWVSDVRKWPRLSAICHQSKRPQSRPCLGAVAITDPWACGLLCLVAHYALSHKCNTPRSASLLRPFLTQHEVKLGPSGILRLEDGVASFVLSPLPDVKWCISLPFSQTPCLSGESLGVNWMKSMENGRLCERHCHRHLWWSSVQWHCFPSPDRGVPVKGRAQGAGELPDFSHLSVGLPVCKLPHIHSFFF